MRHFRTHDDGKSEQEVKVDSEISRIFLGLNEWVTMGCSNFMFAYKHEELSKQEFLGPGNGKMPFKILVNFLPASLIYRVSLIISTNKMIV